MSYDDTEAKELLARHAESVLPDAAGRARAAEALLDELVKLDGTAGFKVQRTPGTADVVVSFAGRNVIVAAPRNGSIVVRRVNDPSAIPISGLRLDRLTGELVGAQEDQRFAPVPGIPPQFRSALAVVVERVLQLMFA
jgi:hypothetical protein